MPSFHDTDKKRWNYRFFSALFILDIIFIMIGIGSSIYAAYRPGNTILDDVFSTLFWVANLFFGLQSLNYVINFRRSKNLYPSSTEDALITSKRKKVAILVPIYNEDPEMVRNNLIAMVNAAKEMANVYVLDDSTNDSAEKNRELCMDLGVPYIRRDNRKGYKAGALNNILQKIDEEYVAVIDIDQTPSPDFLREPVELLDRDPQLALVQVPQLYSNLDSGVLPKIADSQQFIFYEILTEGKSVAGTMFSCGTNVVYRKRALESVGYFDEKSLTEDIATSIKILSKGWKTLYYNKKLVFGRAPVTMEGYINQQWRWARGSLALIPIVLKSVVFSKRFSLGAKIDWFSSSVWYLYGWFYLVFLLAPTLAVLDIRVLTINALTYLLAWIPYTVINLGTFIATHIDKGTSIRTVFYNMASTVILFPLSISVTISTILRKRRPFTTARTGGLLPWYKFTPQFLIMASLAVSFVLLVMQHTWYGYITAFWAAFQFSLFTPIFFINRPARPSTLDAPVLKKTT